MRPPADTSGQPFTALGLECLLRRQWRRLAEAAAAGMLAIFAVVYVWLITDHLGATERRLWQQNLPAGRVTTLAMGHGPPAIIEPLIVDQPPERSIS